MSGRFIAIEGPNGVGKSSVIAATKPKLEAALGVTVWLTKEPSGTLLGQAIRQLEPTLPREGLALACAADRADHVAREIEPAVRRGEFVLSDRYLPSSLVLQRLDGLDIAWLLEINKTAPRADLTLFLDDEPETIIERLRVRPAKGRFESEANTQRELELYRDAQRRLQREGWACQSIDARGLDAEVTADRVVTAIIDKLCGRH